VDFWSPTGALLGTHPFDLGPHASAVLDAASVPGVAGANGSATITHDAGYGEMAGKAVALEPAAGFSFDAPMVLRAR
jgi:hypothetical protein